MWELFAVVIFSLFIFFFQDIAKYAIRKLKPSSGRIIGLSCVAACAVMLAGLVSLIPDGFYNQVTIFLISFGLIIFMTLFVLSLLFIATIPEQMEDEADDE